MTRFLERPLRWLKASASRVRHTKHRWRITIGVTVALLAYPVLGTLALWTGFVEWVARDEDLRLDIANPAYTVWLNGKLAQFPKPLVQLPPAKP